MPATAARKLSVDEQLAEDMGFFFFDPMGFVMYAYDWAKDPALHIVPLQEPWKSRYKCDWGPERWACEFFDQVGAQVRDRNFDGRRSVLPIQEATASGHGIGKSATTAMLVNWIMSTRPGCKGTITAGSYKQLQTKTCPELVKWTKRCITAHWFEMAVDGTWMRHKNSPDNWRCDAISCAKENADSFQGQHSVDATSFYIFDEASAIPDEIWESSDGGLTDGEPMRFAFGNPTQSTGRFKKCFRDRNTWNTRHVDSRSCHIANKEYIQNLVDSYGIDSDYIKVRVLGQFPSMSVRAFYDGKDIDAAYGRNISADQYSFAPKILTLDNAWEGDDEGVIGIRQGLAFRIIKVFPKNDNDIFIATLLAQYEDSEKADAVFIDAGYGTGVVSAGRTMFRAWQLVWFSGESADVGCLNKRAEMANLCKQWLKDGGCIPSDQIMKDELEAITVVPRFDGKIQIAGKKEIKADLGWSPGRTDALWLSFAYPVVKKMDRGYHKEETKDPLFWHTKRR